MTQTQLEQLVAKATGEDIRAIRHLGFSVADPLEVCGTSSWIVTSRRQTLLGN